MSDDQPARLLDRSTASEWREVERDNRLAAEMSAAKAYLQTLGPPPINSALLTGTSIVAPMGERAISAALRRLTRRLPAGLSADPAIIGPADRLGALEGAIRQPRHIPIHLEGDAWISNRRAVDLVRTAITAQRVVIISTPSSLDVLHAAATKIGKATIEKLQETVQQSYDFEGGRTEIWEYACYTGLFGKLYDYAWSLDITDAAFAIFSRDLRRFKGVSPMLLRQIAEIVRRHGGRPDALQATIRGLYTHPDRADWVSHSPPSLRMLAHQDGSQDRPQREPTVAATLATGAEITVAAEPEADPEPEPPKPRHTLIRACPEASAPGVHDQEDGDSDGQDHDETAASVGLPGCSYIYAPAGQAGEYSALAVNPYRGCGHACPYCYVPAAIRMARGEFDLGANERPKFREGLLKDARKYQAAGRTDQVMLSFTTDPYPPDYAANESDPTHLLTRWTLEQLRDHGMAFCTLSKGGSRALRDIDLFRPDRDAYAATLTSLDPAFSRKWERAAADPDDRIQTLRAFHDWGIYTWVSLEPTLDVDASLAIVDATHDFVDLYKVGRANYLKEITRTTDWRDYTHRMIEKLDRLGAKHYIKRDLQEYLPAGYDNPLRVPQHH